MTDSIHDAGPAMEQLAQRVAALERLAETRDILDRTEALATRQRQHVEESRTELLEKLSRVQDDHGRVLARHGEMLTEILVLLHTGRGNGAHAE